MIGKENQRSAAAREGAGTNLCDYGKSPVMKLKSAGTLACMTFSLRWQIRVLSDLKARTFL
jgi:hypothetical protein